MTTPHQLTNIRNYILGWILKITKTFLTRSSLVVWYHELEYIIGGPASKYIVLKKKTFHGFGQEQNIHWSRDKTLMDGKIHGQCCYFFFLFKGFRSLRRPLIFWFPQVRPQLQQRKGVIVPVRWWFFTHLEFLQPHTPPPNLYIMSSSHDHRFVIVYVRKKNSMLPKKMYWRPYPRKFRELT